MTGAVFPPCWLFGLRHPNTGAYSLLSGARSRWQKNSLQESWCQQVFHRTSITSVFVPTLSHSCLCLLEPPPRPAGRSGAGSYDIIASSLGPIAHETLIAPCKCGVSLSPSPVAFLWSSLTDILSQMLQGFLIPMTDPQAGETDMGLRTDTAVGEHQWYYYFSDWGSPTPVVQLVKNPPANAGDTRDASSIPGTGRSPGEGNGISLLLPLLAWKIPWLEGLGGLQSRELQRVAKSWTWLRMHAGRRASAAMGFDYVAVAALMLSCFDFFFVFGCRIIFFFC